MLCETKSRSCRHCAQCQKVAEFFTLSFTPITDDNRVICQNNKVWNNYQLRFLCQGRSVFSVSTLSTSDIMQHVWGRGVVSPNNVLALVHQLRHNLAPTRFRIINIRQQGYIFVDVDSPLVAKD